ncbi:MAG: hypothetical protein ACPGVS_10825, partial [Primorskyibacter sp.]
MKHIIIHCGMPKTGTSALQVQLAKSRDTFLKHGYDYLATGIGDDAKKGRITSGNGFELAQAYLPPKHRVSRAQDCAKITEKMRAAITATPHHVILSSEFFAHLPHPNLGELVTALSDLGKVVLVFMVREQVNALASSYIQGVKRSRQVQFPDEFFADLDLSKHRLLAYNTYFKRLRARAKTATLLVKPYELSKAHPAGLMGLFLEMIGAEIPAGDLPADSHVNLSPSPQEVRMMIEVNRHHPRMRFSDMLVEASHLAGRSTIYAEHAMIPPDTVAKIRAFFDAENAAFFDTFAKCENIYQKAGDTEFINPREVTFEATEVMDMLLGLLVAMDRRLAKLEAG